MKKILITDPIHPDAILQLQKSGFEVTELTEENKQNLSNIIAPYNAIICRTSTTIGCTELDAAKNLEVIALASTGFDRIDAKEASVRNIPILGLPSWSPDIDPERDGNFVSTAEHSIMLILATLGDFSHAYQSMKEGRWEKKFLIGNELANKTVGFIGFGRIAGLVAKRLKAFRVTMIAYDPYIISPEKAHSLGVEMVSMEELYRRSDIIDIHAPRTPETTGMIDDSAFSQMKDGVFIINTARAAIINEDSLLRALESGKVHRIALDVFHDEPNGINTNLIKHPSVIATPHIGGSTHEAWRRISLSTANNIISFFNGTVRNRLNPPTRAIMLAAGMATRLHPLTLKTPKSLLKINDNTILDYQIENLIKVGIKELILVTGFGEQDIKNHLSKKKYPIKITYIHNDEYASTSPILGGLSKVKDYLKEPIIFLHCDVLFGKEAISHLLENPNESVTLYRKGQYDVEAGKIIINENNNVYELGKHIEENRATGEYLQIAKFGQKFLDILLTVINERLKTNRDGFTIEAFNDVIKHEPNIVTGVDFDGLAMEIDTIEDYEKAIKSFKND